MLVETKELEYCKLEVLYEGDADVVKTKRKEAIAELRKLPISGFRKGRAPSHHIISKYGQKINSWVQSEMSAVAYDDTIYENKIKTIGYPQYLDVKLDQDNFTCKMIILKKPDFELNDYKEFNIPRPALNKNVDEQVEATLQDLRERFGDVAPYQEGDFVQNNDQITMDYSTPTIIFKGDQPSGNKTISEGIAKEGILYKVGSNIIAQGFDDNLLGMSAGEERSFTITVDEKPTTFTVKVHMGMKSIPCPLDDALAQKVGLKTFSEVRGKIGAIVSERLRVAEENLVKQQVIARLLENHDFKVPQWLIDIETQHIAAQQGKKLTDLTIEQKTELIERAIKQIKLSLILDSIREKEPEATLTEAELIGVLKNQISVQGKNPEKFVVEAQKAGTLLGMLAQLKDEYALHWDATTVKLID